MARRFIEITARAAFIAVFSYLGVLACFYVYLNSPNLSKPTPTDIHGVVSYE